MSLGGSQGRASRFHRKEERVDQFTFEKQLVKGQALIFLALALVLAVFA
jgi:hypothetical protein